MLKDDFSRLDGESELSYIWRLGQLKDNDVIDMTWDELAEILNRNLRDSEEDWLGSSAYRKKYSLMKQAKTDVFDKSVPQDELEELRNERYELYKERVKLSDERRELNASLRTKARQETFKDQIRNIFEGFKYEPIPIETSAKWLYSNDLDDKTTMLIPVYDIHYGAVVDSTWNKFNPEICKERFAKYVNRIKAIQKSHKAKKAKVILSETISGLIHSALRIESNENVIQQMMGVSNILIWFLLQLSEIFAEVDVYIVPGNHSRLFPNKEDALKGENVDFIIGYCLRGYLQNVDNVYFYENDLDESIASFEINGFKCFAVHGDKDTPDNVCRHITELTHVVPDYCLLGHKHFNSLSTVNGGCKVIQTGSMCGPDSYTIDKRLQGRPEQMVGVFNIYGLNCLYDIDLR